MNAKDKNKIWEHEILSNEFDKLGIPKSHSSESDVLLSLYGRFGLYKDAQAETIAKLREALEFFVAYSDNSGDADGEWQTYAYKKFGGDWSIKQVLELESKYRALLEATK